MSSPKCKMGPKRKVRAREVRLEIILMKLRFEERKMTMIPQGQCGMKRESRTHS